jgi:hypothetical protein
MAVNNENPHEPAGDYRSRPRWSAGKKMDAVLRLLRGEPLETLSRELGGGEREREREREREGPIGWPPGATTFWRAARKALKAQRPDRSGDDRALRQPNARSGR